MEDKLIARLNELMESRGETVYRVSKETGVSQTAIAAWLSGNYSPKLKHIEKLATHFDVPITYFIE